MSGCRDLQGPPKTPEKPKQLLEAVAPEVAMPDHNRLESNTLRSPFSVAQQALTRLTVDNWIEVADAILSVGQSTNEKLSGLAYMVSFCASYNSCTLPHSVMHIWRDFERA